MNEFARKLKKELSDEDINAINLEELNNLENQDNLPLKVITKKNDLNEDQNNGLSNILNWTNSYKNSRNENAFFALRGSAGTGKTTLIGQVLKDIDKNKFRESRICICAPTHKAKKVIGSKTGWQNKETLQKLLGLKLDTNIDGFDPNKPEFTQIGERKIQDYDLVIIDEASMINKPLYDLLVQCHGGTLILFVGDHVQLNPVGEYNISLALTNPIHSYTLTQPARQKVGNPLLDLLIILRSDVENNTNIYLDILKGCPRNINSEGEGYIMTKDSLIFRDNIKEVFLSDDFKQDKDHVRYIAWTNESISRTNKWIRKGIFDLNNTIDIGETILCYRSIIRDEELIFINSDDYIVEKVTPTIISDYTYPLQAIAVDLKCIDTGETTSIIILEREETNYKNYEYIYDEHLLEAKARRTWKSKFYPFKDHILVGDEIKYKNQFLQEEKIKKDLDYGYGITAHKSQGSTYNTVFVNYKDISQIVSFAKQEEKREAEIMKKRLLYVALSRASKVGYIIM